MNWEACSRWLVGLGCRYFRRSLDAGDEHLLVVVMEPIVSVFAVPAPALDLLAGSGFT